MKCTKMKRTRMKRTKMKRTKLKSTALKIVTSRFADHRKAFSYLYAWTREEGVTFEICAIESAHA